MKRNLVKVIRLSALIDNYYTFVIVIYMLSFIVPLLPIGIISSAAMLTIGGLLLIQADAKIKVNEVGKLSILYFLYCIMTSLIGIIGGSLTVNIFIKAASNSLLPMVFLFAALSGYTFNMQKYLNAIHICCLVGIVLLFVLPEWYLYYCIRYGYSYHRLSSCIGSTAVGSLAAVGIIMSVQVCVDQKGKKGKIQYLLTIGYAVLSMQRSAWIVAVLSLVVLHYFVFFKWHLLNCRYLLLEMLAAVIIFVIFNRYIFSLFGTWYAEQISAGSKGMFGSRTGQWINGMQNSNLIIGSGFGSRGHKAMALSLAAVLDGAWVSLLCEVGIIGIAMFAGIIAGSLLKGIRNLRRTLAPMMILIIIVMQAVGSNMFEFQIIMPLVWMSIGEISASYSRRVKNNEDNCFISSTVSCN